MKKSPEKMARGSGIKYVKLVNKIYFQLRFFTACIHTVESLNFFGGGGGLHGLFSLSFLVSSGICMVLMIDDIIFCITSVAKPILTIQENWPLKI